MTRYATSNEYTIWHNEETMKFHIEVRGCQLSRTPYDTAAEAMDSYTKVKR